MNYFLFDYHLTPSKAYFSHAQQQKCAHVTTKFNTLNFFSLWNLASRMLSWEIGGMESEKKKHYIHGLSGLVTENGELVNGRNFSTRQPTVIDHLRKTTYNRKQSEWVRERKLEWMQKINNNCRAYNNKKALNKFNIPLLPKEYVKVMAFDSFNFSFSLSFFREIARRRAQ